MSAFELGGWKFHMQIDIGTFRHVAVLIRPRPDGLRDVFGWNGNSITQKETERIPEEMALNVEPQMLQAMMDGLWELGIRPKDRRYENEATLMAAHLEDMRRLVFEAPPPSEAG